MREVLVPNPRCNFNVGRAIFSCSAALCVEDLKLKAVYKLICESPVTESCTFNDRLTTLFLRDLIFNCSQQ